jgi:calcium-activated chloride channel regulator 3/4
MKYRRFPPTCLFLIAFAFCRPSSEAHDWFTARITAAGTQPVALVGTGEAAADVQGVNSLFGHPIAAADRTLVTTTRTFASTDVPKAIPDNNSTGITSTVAANLAGITALSLSLTIQHTAREDIIVELVSPGGQRISVFNRSSSGTNLVLINFSLPIPSGTLSGNWTLAVRDVDIFDNGSLLAWSLSGSVPTAALLDLVISLRSNPTGDNNGNSQSGVNSEAQNRWERIIGHFADGVYESTEGVHRIRNVRVYRNARTWDKADITWDTAGWPMSSGINRTGGHIFMFETFVDGRGKGVNLDLASDEQGAGYTMAHEWGHYFYGLYDEYAKVTGEISVQPSIMTSQWNARNPADGSVADLRWLNFSIRGPSQANGPFGPFQNTFRNKQHRTYGASAWEVLARPTSSDPTDSVSLGFRSLGTRNYYPELTAVAPTGTPRIDLPNSAARANLNITWMTDRVTTEIVIDKSGSMLDSNKIAQARTAAKLLVDAAELGKTRIGVTAFDNSVYNIISQRDLTAQADKDAIKNAIDSIFAGGDTAIGDAAASALAKITADSSTVGDTRVVFLLTDGQNTAGRDPLSVIPNYTNAQIPLFTFGFGSDADGATLGTLARQTGGQYYFSPSTLAEISSAFRSANLLANSNPGPRPSS